MLDGGRECLVKVSRKYLLSTELARKNVAADVLSRNPCGDSPVEGIGQQEVQVAAINSNSGNPLTALEPIN